MPYRNVHLPEATSTTHLRAAAVDYGVIAKTMMEAIVERCERDADYPFIDTKLDLIRTILWIAQPHEAKQLRERV